MKPGHLLFLSLPIMLIFLSCNGSKTSEDIKEEEGNISKTIYSVKAEVETEAVDAHATSDAADDPAVWVHPEDPSMSLIIGSNKTAGISVYTLDGAEKDFYAVGRINNVDVVYNFPLNGKKIDLCGGTNRTHNSIDIFRIDKQKRELEPILADTVFSDLDDVYGFCFYRSKKNDKYYVYACGKNGEVDQYEIIAAGDNIDLKEIRTLKFDSQNEGLVADHENGILYVGEEEKGIWKLDAEPDGTDKSFIANSDIQTNPNIKYDIEGLTIYYSSKKQGYLIASSQGNNTYAIYERTGDNEYIGSFAIVADTIIDGTQETDGIDVINMNLGQIFPHGAFIAHDGKNDEGNSQIPQNFKLVRWEKIANLFDPPLNIESKFDIRDLMK